MNDKPTPNGVIIPGEVWKAIIAAILRLDPRARIQNGIDLANWIGKWAAKLLTRSDDHAS